MKNLALRDYAKIMLLVLLTGAITVAAQTWVGGATVYSKQLTETRAALHQGILTNVAPGGGSWHDVGAAAMNLRIGTVYLAEQLHKLSGLDLPQVYQLIDTVFLFCALTGLFFYLRAWLPDTYCLIGLLYFATFLHLTYFEHYFAPWDRLQLSIWLLLLYLVRKRRPVLLGICLGASMMIKIDTILVPALYLITHATRHDWRRPVVESAALFAVSFGAYFALMSALPAPLDAPRFGFSNALRMLNDNIDAVVSLNVRHACLLAFGVPALLALAGLRPGDRFVRSSMLFALGLSVIQFTFTIYAELRSQIIVLILVLPAGLLGLQRLLGDAPRPAGPGRHVMASPTRNPSPPEDFELEKA